MTHRTRKVLAFAIVIVILGASYIAMHELRRPPQSTLASAYQAVARAERDGAAVHAAFRLSEAKQMLRLAEATIARENEEPLPFWSYRFADSLLHEVVVLADAAAADAKATKLEIDRELTKTLATLRNNLTYWEQTLEGDLGRVDCRRLLVAARLNLQLATAVARDGQSASALVYADSVTSQLNELAKKQGGHDQSVDLRRSEAIKWIDKTLDYTIRSGEPALVVDKSGHRLLVVRDGKVQTSLPCEVGYNGAYQKRRAGDGATPEGMYKVVELRRQSKYHLALLLDYPNANDRERFRRNLKEGLIPQHASIGSLIEIHGHGGQNEDWTDGCVAVANEHMDYLYKLARVGTPVTIVYGWEDDR